MKVEKTYTSVIITVLLALTCMMSCTDTRVTPDMFTDESSENLIPIVLNLKGLFGPENSPETYAYTPVGDQPGYGNENRIDDITVYIFKSSGVCEKIMVANNLAALRSDTVLVMSGNKTIVAVANKVNFASLPGPGSESSITYSVLKTMMTTPITHLPKPPYLMTGEKSVYLDADKPYTNPNVVEINVERAVAKVKVYVNKDGQAASHALYLHQISLHHGTDRVGLLQTSGSVLYSLDSIVTAVTSPPYHFNPAYATASPTGNIPTLTSGNWCQLIDTFYVYESLCGADSAKGVRLDMQVGVNSPTNYRYASVYVAQNPRYSLPGDTVYDIKRNYWYNVYITIKDAGLDSVYLTVNACPWNVAETQKDTVGGGFSVETAKPFKLVKNYDAIDKTFAPNKLAIDKHTKGASWIDLTVTSGTSWSLAFKSGAPGNPVPSDLIMSQDGGSNWFSSLSGTGTDLSNRIYFYRLYKENAEPTAGPTVTLTVGGTAVRELIIAPRDTAPIPTNCYILRPQLVTSPGPNNESRAYIPLAGVYRQWEDYLLDNGDSIPNGTITADIVWQDRSGNVLKSAPSVINANKRDSAYLYVEAGSVQGNAVVAMKVGGVIYWSFHIWVTEYNPYEPAGEIFYIPSNNVFMDRNLGALTNYYEANGEARGLFYQWGRKDPFPRGAAWTNNMSYYISGAPQTTVTTTTTLTAATVLRPKIAIPASIKEPLKFIIAPAAWPLYQEDTVLWNTRGGKKTAYDPCPEGWRIPIQVSGASTDSPWQGVGTFSDGLPTYLNGGYYPLLGYYPYSGYLDGGSINNTTSQTFYPSSWKGSGASDVTGMRLGPGAVSLTVTSSKSYGLPVRCVVDKDYLINSEGRSLFGSNAGTLEEELL